MNISTFFKLVALKRAQNKLEFYDRKVRKLQVQLREECDISLLQSVMVKFDDTDNSVETILSTENSDFELSKANRNASVEDKNEDNTHNDNVSSPNCEETDVIAKNAKANICEQVNTASDSTTVEQPAVPKQSEQATEKLVKESNIEPTLNAISANNENDDTEHTNNTAALQNQTESEMTQSNKIEPAIGEVETLKPYLDATIRVQSKSDKNGFEAFVTLVNEDACEVMRFPLKEEEFLLLEVGNTYLFRAFNTGANEYIPLENGEENHGS